MSGSSGMLFRMPRDRQLRNRRSQAVSLWRTAILQAEESPNPEVGIWVEGYRVSAVPRCGKHLRQCRCIEVLHAITAIRPPVAFQLINRMSQCVDFRSLSSMRGNVEQSIAEAGIHRILRRVSNCALPTRGIGSEIGERSYIRCGASRYLHFMPRLSPVLPHWVKRMLPSSNTVKPHRIPVCTWNAASC